MDETHLVEAGVARGAVVDTACQRLAPERRLGDMEDRRRGTGSSTARLPFHPAMVTNAGYGCRAISRMSLGSPPTGEPVASLEYLR